MADTLYIVIPCYKEREVLPETARRIKEKMEALTRADSVARDSRVLFVNDGSDDGTWEIIQSLCQNDPLFGGVNLSRNRGHQNALMAGLATAADFADCVISMDADLQDDIDAIDRMLEAYYAGSDIVYGVRSSRENDTLFKRATAQGFYKFMAALGVEVIYNHADYRLMSARAVRALMQYGETNLFLRGIVPQLGFPWTTVEYARAPRFAGQSKYPLKKMLAFALDGVTSFSVKPIRMVLWVGATVFLVSIVMLLWGLIAKCTGNTVSGWSSLMCSIWMLGGIQLLSLGIIGEYVGKVYSETKRRPRYIVESVLLKPGKKS